MADFIIPDQYKPDTGGGGGGGAVDSVNGRTGAVTLTKGDVNLQNVDNTSDLAKPISSATATALTNKLSTGLPTGKILVGNASNLATSVAVSGDISLSSIGVATIKPSVNLSGSPRANSLEVYGGDITMTSGGRINSNQYRNFDGSTLELRMRGANGNSGIFFDATDGTESSRWVSSEMQAFFVDPRYTIDQNAYIGVGSPYSLDSRPEVKLDVDGDVKIKDVAAYYIGSPDADGSWRRRIDGKDLVDERRDSGVWLEKNRITA